MKASAVHRNVRQKMMKSFLVFAVSLCLCAGVCAQNAPKVAQPPDGVYVSDPSKGSSAGEIITISGSSFRYSNFNHAASGPPDRMGKIIFFPDHILLDAPEVPDPERIPDSLGGVPVLWTEEGYADWKRTGKIREHCVVYLRKK